MICYAISPVSKDTYVITESITALLMKSLKVFKGVEHSQDFDCCALSST